MFLLFLQLVAKHFLPLALHLESGSFPRPLTAQEEAQAFAAMQAGDLTARDRLIRHNLRLVAHIAKKYYAHEADQEDFISIGTIGLMKAVSTFEPTRGRKFATYASRCIENELRMHLRRKRREPPTFSLQEPIEGSREDSDLTVLDSIPDDFVLEDAVELRGNVQELNRLLSRMTGREKLILQLRFGLNGGEPMTQQQVANRLRISRSYVSRLEKRGLAELRAHFSDGSRD